jgi:hypothetical protein
MMLFQVGRWPRVTAFSDHGRIGDHARTTKGTVFKFVDPDVVHLDLSSVVRLTFDVDVGVRAAESCTRRSSRISAPPSSNAPSSAKFSDTKPGGLRQAARQPPGHAGVAPTAGAGSREAGVPARRHRLLPDPAA